VTELYSGPSAPGPAEKAGIKPEEVVLGVDGHAIDKSEDLSNHVAGKAPGTVVELRVLGRDGKERTLSVTLGTFPEQTSEKAEEARHGRLGMTLQDLTPALAERLELPRAARGAVVIDVEAGEAAENAGLQKGDLIESVNGRPVSGVESFEGEIDRSQKEGITRLRVRRGDSHLILTLKLS
jgi:serine protease Do